MKVLHEGNRVLTSDEMSLVVDTATMMANMGVGIDPETCLGIINVLLKKRIDSADFDHVTIGVVKQLIGNDDHRLICKLEFN